MGLFDAIPRPKSKFGRFVAIITGIATALIAIYYLVIKIDIVPDIGPFGYLDDVIVLLVLGAALYRFISHIRHRYTAGAQHYKSWFKKLSIKSLLDPKLWVVAILIAAALAYFFWTIDIIPDTIPYTGYVDDLLTAIGSGLLLLQTVFSKRKVRR